MADDEGEVYWKHHPGTKVVVFYTDDDVWHERYILLPGFRPEVYWIVTPDDDIYEEDLRGRSEDGPHKVRVVPLGVRTLPNLRTSVYRFREDVSDDLWKSKMKIALEEHEQTYGSTDKFVDLEAILPSGKRATIGSLASRRRLVGKGPVTRAPPEKQDAWTAPPGRCWRAAEPRGLTRVGELLTPTPGVDRRLGDVDAAFLRDNGWIRGELVRDVDYDDWLVERTKELTGVAHARSDPARLLGILPDVGKAIAPEGGTIDHKEKVTDNDIIEGNGDGEARTLWVEYDAHGERHREWRQVVADSVTHNWKDWPHEGPPSLLYAMKQFQKIGGDPRLWFQLWLRRHHLSESDRTAHEVRSLVEAIYLGGCYDQLNLPSLASFEALGRRLQTITEAYASAAGGPPEWHHARLFTGSTSADEIVPQELRSWAAKRGKDEVELIQARSKAKEVRRLLNNADTTASSVEDALPPGGKPKGRGRTRKNLDAPETS